jgi:hypothetical protein
MILTDPINLLCDLIEAGVGSFEAKALRSEAPQAVEFLLKIGALMPGQPARVLTGCACHDDHSIRLEFEPRTRRHWYFCPEAGASSSKTMPLLLFVSILNGCSIGS